MASDSGFFHSPMRSLPPDVLKDLSADQKINLLTRELHTVSEQVGGVKKTLAGAVRGAGALCLMFLGVALSAIMMVGAYRERVDTLTHTVERLEQRTEQLSDRVSALTAAIEAQKGRPQP